MQNSDRKIFSYFNAESSSFFDEKGFCLFRPSDPSYDDVVNSNFDYYNSKSNQKASDFKTPEGVARHIPKIFRDSNSPALTLFQHPTLINILIKFFPKEDRKYLAYTHSKISLKSSTQSVGWYPHQDTGYKKDPHKHNGITVVVCLEDMDETNGCLRVFPGSHKLGPIRHTRTVEHIGTGEGQYQLTEFANEDGYPIYAQKGDILIFSLNLIHYSGISVSNSKRLTMITELETAKRYKLDADGYPPIRVYNSESRFNELILYFLSVFASRRYKSKIKLILNQTGHNWIALSYRAIIEKFKKALSIK